MKKAKQREFHAPMHGSDAEAAASIMAGNEQDFSLIATRYAPYLQRFLRRYLRSRVDVQDITQESLRDALLALRQGRYTEQDKMLNWLYRYARINLLRHLDKKKRFVLLPLSNEAQLADETPALVPDRRLSLRLGRALKKLSPRQ